MGAVNIFLGGTGKAVAEDIQDSREFHGLPISEPIAFDLNATVRAGVALDLVAPGGGMGAAVASLAAEWGGLEPGARVGPAPPCREPGPQISPEHSLLVKIGEGIDRDPAPSAGLFALRAHGLAVFSILFDERHAVAGAGPGNDLRNRIAARVREQTFGDRPPRINLVTSTAGGTGAGTVIPLALWLREQYPKSALNLVAVTASAFRSVLQGNPDLDELAAKGRSGTFAMLRELSFFSQATDPQTTFSPRRLPVTGRGLAYQPRQPLFDRVCWFGGRDGGQPRDAFEEAGVLLRLLSEDGSADDLAAEMDGRPMQWVGAVTAIEYPKLRYQRRLISHVLEEAYGVLHREAVLPPGAPPDDTTIVGYISGATARPLGGWFYRQRHGALALPSGPPVDAAAAVELAGRLKASSGYDAVPRGADMQGDGYDSDMRDWHAYTGQVKSGLDAAAARKQGEMLEAIRDVRREEEIAFGEWLARDVLQQRLGGDGDTTTPTGDMLELLKRLDTHATTLHARFGQDHIFPTEKNIDECDEAIRVATDQFDRPPPYSGGLSRTAQLISWISGGIAFLAVVGVARLISGFTVSGVDSELLVWIAALASMFFAHRGVRWALMRGQMNRASLSARRKRAEDRLFAAYEERDRVRALQWLHGELRGSNGTLPFFRELREQIAAARAAVADLEEVYKALENRATAAVTQATTSAPHVVAEVGDGIIADKDLARNIVRQLQQRLRVEAQEMPGPRVRGLRLRLGHADDGADEPFRPALAEAGTILQAVQGVEQDGLVDAQRTTNLWSESVWNLINWKLDEDLPADFSEALAHNETRAEGATLTLASKLQGVGAGLPRRPSVELQAAASAPARRRVYVGSDAILGEFNRALAEPVLRAHASVFGAYERPRVVPALGEQIVFLDLWADPGDQQWAPRVIGSATEAQSAMQTYYGAEAGVRRSRPPRRLASQCSRSCSLQPRSNSPAWWSCSRRPSLRGCSALTSTRRGRPTPSCSTCCAPAAG